jgi:hypothetical protein
MAFWISVSSLNWRWYKMNRITTLAVLIGLAVLAAPPSGSAQCIEVTPENWDYGDVKVGTPKSQIFTIENCTSTDLYIFLIQITDDPTGAFSITSAPALPIIPGWESREVEVTFTPPSLGAHEAFLYIVSDAPNSDIYIDLLGVGVRGWRCFEAKAAP